MYNSRLIRLPQQKLSIIFLLLRASNSLPAELKINTAALMAKTNEELYAKGKPLLTLSEIEDALLLLASNAQTLDAPISSSSEDTESRTLGETLADTTINIEGDVDTGLLAFRSHDELMQVLDPLEAQVIFYRFLDPSFLPKRSPERPYSEIPRLLKNHGYGSMSGEKVRQIEGIALAKIKQSSSWFWDRIKDDILRELLSENEMDVLFCQTVFPKLKNQPELCWSETAAATGLTPREVMQVRRSLRKKLRRSLPDLEAWL